MTEQKKSTPRSENPRKTTAAPKKPGTGTRRPKVDGAFGRKKTTAAKPLPPKKKGIQVPPAVPKPLFKADGSADVQEAVLQYVLGVTSALPDTKCPEIAFAGKSNVGKSSLMNALVNRKALARISAQPGKTQTINFYRINGILYFVDLPGYGYANASEEEKAAWGTMIENYLHKSENLKAVFLLVDIRHDPSGNDLLMYRWIRDQGLTPVIIATKADKLGRNQCVSQKKKIREVLDLPDSVPVIAFSSETKQGREELFGEIRRLTAAEA